MCTLSFFGFRVRPMETFPNSGTAKGCDTEEMLLPEGLEEGGTGCCQDGRQPAPHLSSPLVVLTGPVTVRRNRRVALL